MMSSIGMFSEKGNEYIINKAELKRPMVNYFWNRKILCAVNQNGGGNGSARGLPTSAIYWDVMPR